MVLITHSITSCPMMHTIPFISKHFPQNPRRFTKKSILATVLKTVNETFEATFIISLTSPGAFSSTDFHNGDEWENWWTDVQIVYFIQIKPLSPQTFPFLGCSGAHNKCLTYNFSNSSKPPEHHFHLDSILSHNWKIWWCLNEHYRYFVNSQAIEINRCLA